MTRRNAKEEANLEDRPPSAFRGEGIVLRTRRTRMRFPFLTEAAISSATISRTRLNLSIYEASFQIIPTTNLDDIYSILLVLFD